MKNIKAHFKRNKKYRSIYGSPPVGSFALVSASRKPIYWEHCREHFALKFTESTSGFFFSHPCNKADDIANFLTKIEYVLSLNQKSEMFDFSLFRKTCRQNILWIEPSLFWKSCKIRRSLLTILLRCAFNYCSQLDNFDDALFGNYKENTYIKDTKHAFLRFMFGFTFWAEEEFSKLKSNDDKHGWREEFLNLDKKEVKAKLFSPNSEKKYLILFESDFLWC